MAYKTLDRITVSDIEAAGIPFQEAEQLHLRLSQILRTYGAATPDTWKNIYKHLLNPNLPFSFHQMMYYGCYKDTNLDPPPAWIPDREIALSTNIGQVLEKHGKRILGLRYRDPISSFAEFQEFSIMNPEVYWRMIFDEMNISFSVPPSCILREHTTEEGRVLYPGGQWLPGAVMNSAGSCLNLNGKKSVDDVMIKWRNEGDDELPVNFLTLKELSAEVCLVANALETLGLKKGSAIAIDMPMNVTAVIIYLAIVLAGYVVVSIADSFAPREISLRLEISNAKAIFTQDFILRGGKSLPLYRRVVDAHAPLAIIVPATGSNSTVELRDCDITWHSFLERVKHLKAIDYTAVDQSIEAPTNILFSSGTTGEPKAIPWTHSTPLKAAADAWSHMDIHKGDVVCWPTNLGWMMGPWLVYAALLNGASIAIYDGSPLGPGFAKFVQVFVVSRLGVRPGKWKQNTDVLVLPNSPY